MDKRRSPLILAGLAIVAIAGLGFLFIWARRSADQGVDGSARGDRPLVRPSEQIPGLASPGREGESARDSHPPGTAPESKTSALPRSPKEIAALRAMILDEAARPQQRVDALRNLRYSGEDWKEPVIIGSMTRLMGSATDDGVRMNVCRYLRGADTAEFRQQLLNSSTGDPVPGVRREAVVSLRPMAADPVVQETLKRALATERNAGVKSALELTLQAGKRR